MGEFTFILWVREILVMNTSKTLCLEGRGRADGSRNRRSRSSFGLSFPRGSCCQQLLRELQPRAPRPMEGSDDRVRDPRRKCVLILSISRT